MDYTSVFERREIKFLCPVSSIDRLIQSIEGHATRDRYAHSSVRSVYYDTPDFRVIRRSIEKPCYKEKLRLRCYGEVDGDSSVFVEMKKKYKGIVYKRRVALPLSCAEAWLSGGDRPYDTQICREIDYFRDYYSSLRPTVYLTYEREAYVGCEDRGLRLTLDTDVRAEFNFPSLLGAPTGISVLPPGTVLFEVKTPVGIPLWLARVLSELKIYKTSFSKYGEAYIKNISIKENSNNGKHFCRNI